MRKLRSVQPWPCPWVAMLSGMPSRRVWKSVPWSRLNPRTKYWLAFPSPECCVTIMPGTVSSADASFEGGPRRADQVVAAPDDRERVHHLSAHTVLARGGPRGLLRLGARGGGGGEQCGDGTRSSRRAERRRHGHGSAFIPSRGVNRSVRLAPP